MIIVRYNIPQIYFVVENDEVLSNIVSNKNKHEEIKTAILKEVEHLLDPKYTNFDEEIYPIDRFKKIKTWDDIQNTGNPTSCIYPLGSAAKKLIKNAFQTSYGKTNLVYELIEEDIIKQRKEDDYKTYLCLKARFEKKGK